MTCAECGYDLRGLPDDSACPECGRRIADTAAALPVTRWLPGFRRGVACLGVALLVMPFAEDTATSRMRWFGVLINPDGLLYLTHALLLLPAAFWMTLPAPFLRRDPARLRAPLLALLGAQIIAAAVAIAAFPSSARAAHVALLTTYALAPLPHVAATALLLMLLVRPLPLVPRSLPRWLTLGVIAVIVASMLGRALVTTLVNFARLHRIDRPIGVNDTYLPRTLSELLDTFVMTPAVRAHWPLWAASLLLVGHCLLRLYGPVGLPRREPAREAAGESPPKLARR